MEVKRLVALLCLTSFITISSFPLNVLPERVRLNSNYGHIIQENNLDLILQHRKDSSFTELSTPQNNSQIIPANVSTINNQSTIPHSVFKRNAVNSSLIPPAPQLFPQFGKQLVSRRSSGGWSSWGLDLMNQYFGNGWGQSHHSNHQGHSHQGNYNWPYKPTHHKASQAVAISKVIFTKAKLMGQMLELKRISTNKFVDAILFLNKLKTVPKPLFGNLNNPHHYLHNGLPTVSTHVETTGGHGWQSSFGTSSPSHPDIGGRGWGEDSKTTAFTNLGYSIGSSLAGVSKFAKLLGQGYNFGTENQRWLSHGFGHANLNDYYPTFKTPDPNKGQFDSDQNTGPQRLKAYENHGNNNNHNHPRPGSGFGYNYGDGNEYNSVKGGGWSDSPPSTNFGGVVTTGGGGSGSGDSFVYEEGGNEVTPGLRIPTFKPIATNNF